MKFKDYTYSRPNYDQYKKNTEEKLTIFEQAKSSKEQIDIFNEIIDLRRNISTMMTLSDIRFTLNAEDEFYVEENEYWDEMKPLYEEITNNFYQSVVNSKYIDELKQEIPDVYFQLLEASIKAFDSKIITDLQEENKLCSRYAKLFSSAQIEFDGNIYNIPQMTPLLKNKNREYRHRAFDAKMSFFADNEEAFDDIYDKLVKVRDSMAKKMGYKNFIELGYYRMSRLDYDEKMVDNYRKQILEEIVPIANEVYSRQQKRLGYDTLHYYDEAFEFVDGNATPQGTFEETIESAKNMYHELSDETAEFIDFMIEKELLDLVARKGKQAGGYCSFIDEYQSPFIFANFNGTSGDIDVLTHEAGHAFQCFQSRWIKIP